MATVRALVLRAAGINCDEETVFAWRMAGAAADRLHVKRLIESPALLQDYQVLTVPGGFSYGDDIASGRILGNMMRHHLGDAIRAFVDRGGLVIGICNGFQVLVRMGLLPGDDCGVPTTITWNASGQYEDRWVRVRCDASNCSFFPNGHEFDFPVAHGEGRIDVAGGRTAFDRLAGAGRVAMRYVSLGGGPPVFPENPNGSIGNTAGLTDATGRVLGLMPHPERSLFAVQRPDRSRDFNADNAGPGFFRRIVEQLR